MARAKDRFGKGLEAMGAHLYSDKAKFARAIFFRTKELHYGIIAYNASKSAAELSRNCDPKHSAYSYNDAGRDAYENACKTGKGEWWKNSYYNHMKAGDIQKGLGDKQSEAFSRFNAAEAAYHLEFNGGGDEWGDRGIRGYQFFVDHYRKNGLDLDNAKMRALEGLKMLRERRNSLL
jgi:hypothetical protein